MSERPFKDIIERLNIVLYRKYLLKQVNTNDTTSGNRLSETSNVDGISDFHKDKFQKKIHSNESN